MPIEMMNGEKPSFTSFVGASAVPSHTAAASPQKTPSLWSEMVDRIAAVAVLSFMRLPQGHQKCNSQHQHHHGHPEMHVSHNCQQGRSFA